MASWWTVGLFVGIVGVVLRRLLKKSRQCPSADQMNDKTVVITGANSGLGKAAAIELARRKAKVILACRTQSSAEKTAKEIRSITGNSEIVPYEVELGSFKSIREFCKKLLAEQGRIDVLVNNAGVYAGPYMETEEGLEVQMGVNHFGHFLLTSLLIERVTNSAPSRIVILSSSLSKRGSIDFDDINGKNKEVNRGYANSKLANLLFARKLSEKLEGTGVDVFGLHPGLVATNLARYVLPSVAKVLLPPIISFLGIRDADEGCQSIVYCSVARSLQGRSGLYIGKCCNEESFPPKALDRGTADKLWELSERITNTVF